MITPVKATMMSTARIRVLQITDPHLFADASATLMGINTSATLDAVLAKVHSDFQAIECLLVTGDLTQDDSEASYRHLTEKLSTLKAPGYWLCGNHDQPGLMTAVNPSAMKKQVLLGKWQILLLNTRVDGEVFGYLSDSELALLDSYLAQEPDKHCLLALHHHPAPINSQWMDSSMLKNPDDLALTLSQHSNVRGIIHGHVHQARDYEFCGLPVMATPSTCVQFAPESDEFLADTRQPGFRVLDLMPDGQIESQVIRISDESMKINLESKGY
ncbi:3',5'-cyclic-AMP phosphodiesterase [Endozoicomonas sp.]|uniref:3',5'-cyclic-AMP phosphodiesterase n=1 Tax=Endozoicomonas sp. TaxID=1892382 RepID=UPI002885CB3B|nr:3',5'-cyclic-AMP phosphodiesterase [Endozoicomonas sp.]